MKEETIINEVEPKEIDYEEIDYRETRDDITDEIPLTTSISNIGLSGKVSNLLRRYGVNDLERLLKVNYKDLKHVVRGLGPMGRNEILICVHKLGYELPGENLAVNYQSLERKARGELLLEDLGLPGMARKALNRAGIYTMNDLENSMGNLDEIPNFGSRKKEIVETWLKGLNSEEMKEENLNTTQDSLDQEVLNLQTINNELQQEIDDIKERIAIRQNLLEEYQRLIAEREQLLQQEQDLDRKLDQIRGEQHATGPNLTKTTNPGK